MIPRDILETLFRALVYVQPGELTSVEINTAWSWLEQHNHYEEMGQ